MIPTFREGLLQTEEDNPDKDNLLKSLKNLFLKLILTEYSSIHSQEFCYSFKDLEGQPTN